MDANTKYTLIVFNTCTQKYEEVTVTEEVYRAYYRTGWNIKDNDQSFFDHEIQLSGMIWQPGWRIRETSARFVDILNYSPRISSLPNMEKEDLYRAVSALPAEEQL